jgi:hypothetical protein
MSIKTSEDGVNFAREAIELCGFLGQDKPVEHILSFIEELQITARDAHESAKATLKSFTSIRNGVLDVSHCLNTLFSINLAYISGR